MDVLHSTKDANGQAPKVLYLLAPYNGSSFEDFPRRFMNDVIKASSPDEQFEISFSKPFSWTWEQLAFAQSWLYFGLLIEVLNEALGCADQGQARLTTEDFIYVEDMQSYVSSHVHSYLPRWKERAMKLENSNRVGFERSRDSILRMINESWVFAKRYLTHDPAMPVHNQHIVAVQTSIIVLGSFLDSFASNLYNRNPHNWPTSLLALAKFSKMCPSDCLRLESQFSQATIYYISSLEWPKDPRTHERCRTEECVAYQISDNDLPTKHVDSCNGCPMSGPSAEQMERLENILEHDGIPSIQVEDCSDGSGNPRINIVGASEHDFVAFSHVWSDGLGNPRGNELPSCQIGRLRQLVLRLTGGHDPIPFFIDTICVPLRKSLRKLAIRKLKTIYKEARYVLVLDFQLEKSSIGALQTASDTSLHKEAATRIVTSGWMRRLWTFQEGRLAKNLYFQFANQAINHMTLIVPLLLSWKFQNTYDEIAGQILSRMISITEVTSRTDYGHGFQDLSDAIGWPDTHLRQIFNAIAWRTTSKPEDEAVCLASLLGIDPGYFLDIELDQHIPQLLQRLQKVPIDFLFSPGERHQSDGFSWCPKSFLNSHKTYTALQRSSLVECTGSGLKVRLPGWMLPPSTVRPSKSTTQFGDQKVDGFTWQMQDPRWDDSPVYFIYHTFDMTEEQRRRQLAVLIDPCRKISGVEAVVGVCVMLLRKDVDIVSAKFLCHVSVVRDSLQHDALGEISPKPCLGYGIAETQHWCIV